MNPELQRLTNLRDFFVSKRTASDNLIRTEQTRLELWHTSIEEVDRAIAQAKKEQPKPEVCKHCGTTDCAHAGTEPGPTPCFNKFVAEAKLCPTCKVPYTEHGGCGCTLKMLAERAEAERLIRNPNAARIVSKPVTHVPETNIGHGFEYCPICHQAPCICNQAVREPATRVHETQDQKVDTVNGRCPKCGCIFLSTGKCACLKV